jgi:Ca2+-transporting ATPase
MKWHVKKIKEILKELESNKKGLNKAEARKRLRKFGPNELIKRKKVSPLGLLVEQFRSPLVIILIIAALISYFVGFLPGVESRIIDAILILAIVFANAIFGFIQNYKAEESIEALKKMVSLKAVVLRNGGEEQILARDLVPGDIILINEGDRIPADARLLEESSLHVDESPLTGESVPEAKEAITLKPDTHLAERKNMIYMNTLVTRGKGKAIITATGMQTEVGKIAAHIQKAKERPTPFQDQIGTLGKKIGIGIIGIIIFIAAVQLLIGIGKLLDIFLTAISLAVAAIPEGLPAVVTFALALGTRKMAKQKAVTRKLPVIESLGSVDTICADKTGTLTEDKMTVREIYFDNKIIRVTGTGYETKGNFFIGKKKFDSKELHSLLKVGLYCNDAVIKEGGDIGDPTEIALVVSAKKAGLERVDYKRIREIPFSSERKRMTTVHRHGKEKITFMKGAPEIVLERCDRIYEKGKIKKLTQKKKKDLLRKNGEMARRALRVLGFAYKKSDKNIEKNLVFLGLQGMIDPPREGVKKSVSTCKKAGIRVVMITGDNKLTAEAVAKEIGIGGKSLEGRDIEKISDEKIRELVKEVNIFARIEPIHKVRILKALQKNGHIVAMTGDGVNDAPALKNADIGISMGIRGTDVAKEASDMVLLDDNFVTIEGAVKQGRTIFDNIRKFVNYLLSCNLAEVFIIFFASLFGYLPLTAVQILWINLLTDGMPAVALGNDPSVPGVMQRKPRKKGEGVIDKKLMWLIIGTGLELTAILLVIFAFGMRIGINYAGTMVFTGLVIFEFMKLWVMRYSEKLSIFANKWLILAVIASFFLQLVILYSPLNIFFGIVPLGLFDWFILIIGAMIFYLGGIGITKLVDHFSY